MRDLPTRELGVDVEQRLRAQVRHHQRQDQDPRRAEEGGQDAATIYLATDPDREGEAIAWHVADQIRLRACRCTASCSTRSPRTPCRRAMDSPAKIDERKVDAQQARRILDRLVGYKASPILWRTIKTGLSAGRVQTVALRLIVEREREIRAFTPQEYWTIEALCARGRARPSRPRWSRWTGTSRSSTPRPTPARWWTRCGACRSSSPRSSSAAARRARRAVHHQHAPAGGGQEAAASPPGGPCARRRSSTRAWTLGEDGPVGLITYMRTDSVRVSETRRRVGARLIGEQLRQALPARAQPNIYSDRKNARVQDAHEAIRPTDVRRRPEQVQQLPRARPVPALPAHLAALRRVADDAGACTT